MKSTSRSVDGEFAEPAAKRPKLDESIIINNNNNNNNNNNSSRKNNNSNKKETISSTTPEGVIEESRAGSPKKVIENSKGPPPPPPQEDTLTSEGESGDLLAQVCSFIGIDEELRVEEDNLQTSVSEGAAPQGLYPSAPPEVSAGMTFRPPTVVVTSVSREFRTEPTYVEIMDPRAQVRPPEARIPQGALPRGPHPHAVWAVPDGRRYYTIGEGVHTPHPTQHRLPATNSPELRYPYRQRFLPPPASSFTLPPQSSLPERHPRPPLHPHPLHYAYYPRGPDFPPPPPPPATAPATVTAAAVTVAAPAYRGRFPLPGPPQYVAARFPRLPNGHIGSPQGHSAETGDPHYASYPLPTKAKTNAAAPVHPPHGLRSHDTLVTTCPGNPHAQPGVLLRPQESRTDMVRPSLRPPEQLKEVVHTPVQWIEPQRVPTAVPSQRPYLQQQIRQEGNQTLDKPSPKEPRPPPPPQPPAPQLHAPPRYPYQPSGDFSKSREQYRGQPSAELIPLGPYGHVVPEELLPYHSKPAEPFAHHDSNTSVTPRGYTKPPVSISNVPGKPPSSSCEVVAVDIERVCPGQEMKTQSTGGGIRKVIKPPRPNVELIPLGPLIQKPTTTTTGPAAVTSVEVSSMSGYPAPYRSQPSPANIIISPSGRNAPPSHNPIQDPTNFPFPSSKQPTSQASSPQSQQGIASPSGISSQRQAYPFSTTALPPASSHYSQSQNSPSPCHQPLTSPHGTTSYSSYHPSTSKATVNTTPPTTMESPAELASPVKIHIQPNPAYNIAQTVVSPPQKVTQTEQLVSPVRSHDNYLSLHSAFPEGNTSKAPTIQSSQVSAQFSAQQEVHSAKLSASTVGPVAPISVATSQTTSAIRAQSQEHSGECPNGPPVTPRSDTGTNKSSTSIPPSTVAYQSPFPNISAPERRAESPRRNSATLEIDPRNSRGSSDSLSRSSSEHFRSDAIPDAERGLRIRGNSGQDMSDDDTFIDVVSQDGRWRGKNPPEGDVVMSDHSRPSGEDRPRSGAEVMVDVTKDLVSPGTKVTRAEGPRNLRTSDEVSGSPAQEIHNPLSQPMQVESSASIVQSNSMLPSNPNDSRPPSHPSLSPHLPDSHSRNCHKSIPGDQVERSSISGDRSTERSTSVVEDLSLAGKSILAAKVVVDVRNHKAGELRSPGLRHDDQTETKDSQDNMVMCSRGTEDGTYEVKETNLPNEERLMEVNSLKCIETVVESVGNDNRNKDSLRRDRTGIDSVVKNEKCVRDAQSQSRQSSKRTVEGTFEATRQHINNHLLSLTKAKNNEFYLKLKMVLTDLLTVPAALELRHCNLTPGELLEKILVQCGLPVITHGTPEERMELNFRSVVFHCMSQELLKSWGWTKCSTDKILDDLLDLSCKGSTSGEDMRVDKVPLTAHVDPREGVTSNSGTRKTLGVGRTQQGSDEEADRIDRQREARMSTVPIAIHNLEVTIKEKKIGNQLEGSVDRQAEGVIMLGERKEHCVDKNKGNSGEDCAPEGSWQVREADGEDTGWEWIKNTSRRYNLRNTPITDYRILNEGIDLGMDSS